MIKEFNHVLPNNALAFDYNMCAIFQGQQMPHSDHSVPQKASLGIGLNIDWTHTQA